VRKKKIVENNKKREIKGRRITRRGREKGGK
jgi:hypothetical protein